MHPRSWKQELLNESALNDVDPRHVERLLPERLIERQDREFTECDRIVLYSSASQQSFETFPYFHKTVVVSPGINDNFFRPAPRLTDGKFRVCYVGRVEPAKGVNYLIEAWRQLALPDAELLLIGDLQPGTLPLHGNISIRALGIQTPAEVAESYRRSDIFILPSMNEGLSRSLLEAMASGMPVIACRNTGAEDCVIHERNGILVEGRSVPALVEAIEWCYRHRDDLADLGTAARETIEKGFTLDRYAQRVCNLYADLLSAEKITLAPGAII